MDIRTEDVEFARRELDNISLLRETARMVVGGLSQEEVAEAMETSPERAKRLMNRASFLMEYDGIPVSPREIIYKAAVGEMTRGAMLDLLVRCPYTYSEDAEPSNPLSVRTEGSWDDLMMCYFHGLLSLNEMSTVIDLREDLRKDGLL